MLFSHKEAFPAEYRKKKVIYRLFLLVYFNLLRYIFFSVKPVSEVKVWKAQASKVKVHFWQQEKEIYLTLK